MKREKTYNSRGHISLPISSEGQGRDGMYHSWSTIRLYTYANQRKRLQEWIKMGYKNLVIRRKNQKSSIGGRCKDQIVIMREARCKCRVTYFEDGRALCSVWPVSRRFLRPEAPFSLYYPFSTAIVYQYHRRNPCNFVPDKYTLPT